MPLHPLVRTLGFTVLIPGLVAGVVPAVLAWCDGRAGAPVTVVRLCSSLALFVPGLVLYGWTAWLFASVGRGTPGPWDPPRRLVTSGPYRLSSNPMYVGVLGVILGEALLYDSWWVAVYAIVVCTAFNERIRRYEEPVLAAEFGAQFEEYRRRVRRWF